MERKLVSRRTLLKSAALLAMGTVINACAQSAPAPAAAPTQAAPAEPTKAPPPEATKAPAAEPTKAAAAPTAAPTPTVEAAPVTATPAAQASEKITLAFQFWDGEPYMSKIIKPSGQRFMDKNPNVSIEFQLVAWEEYMPKLLAQMAAGTPVDVFWGNLGEAIPIVVKNPELFYDVEPLLQRDHKEMNLEDDFWPTAKEGSVYKGRYWGVCWGTGATMYVFYNKKMFADAGLKTPAELFDEGKWTVDAYTEAAVKLTKREGNQPVQFGSESLVSRETFAPFLMAMGGSFFDKENTKVTLTESQGMKALQWLEDLNCQHKVAPQAEWGKTTEWRANGKMGMHLNWDGFIPEWRGYTQTYDWDIAPPPSGSAGWQSWATSNLYCMSKTGKHTDAAWAFVKHEMGPEEDLFYAKEYGWVPFRKTNLPAWLKEMEKLAPPRNLKYFEQVQGTCRLEPLTPAWGGSLKAWTNEIQDPILAGCSRPIKDSVAAWAEEATKLLAEANA